MRNSECRRDGDKKYRENLTLYNYFPSGCANADVDVRTELCYKFRAIFHTVHLLRLFPHCFVCFRLAISLSC